MWKWVFILFGCGEKIEDKAERQFHSPDFL